MARLWRTHPREIFRKLRFSPVLQPPGHIKSPLAALADVSGVFSLSLRNKPKPVKGPIFYKVRRGDPLHCFLRDFTSYKISKSSSIQKAPILPPRLGQCHTSRWRRRSSAPHRSAGPSSAGAAALRAAQPRRSATTKTPSPRARRKVWRPAPSNNNTTTKNRRTGMRRQRQLRRAVVQISR